MRRSTRNEARESGTRRRLAKLAGGTLRIAALALVLGSICLPATAGTGPKKSKLSRDLVEMRNGLSPAATVRLIVRAEDEGTRQLIERVAALGGTVKGVHKKVGAVILELPLDAVDALLEIDGVEYVTPDRPVAGTLSDLQQTTGAGLVYGDAAGSAGSGIDGSGIGIAVLDSGIQLSRHDLRADASRVVLRANFTGVNGPVDEYGHGTHIAGLIAGNGAASLRAGRDYSGIAPNANLLDLKVLDGHGRGSVSSVIAAIDFAIEYREAFNIRVLNLSLAAAPVDSYRDDPLCQAVERAVEAGIVVVVAAGNFGMDGNGNELYGGIASPGNSPAAITVGAANTHGTVARSDDDVAPFSSRGPTLSGRVDPSTGDVVPDNLAKPDLVAPGVALPSLESNHNLLVTENPVIHLDTGRSGMQDLYMALSGTSAAAGVVSGTVALMLQANPSLTPNLVKSILMYSAQILDGPDLFEQGAGELNADGAVRMSQALSQESEDLSPGERLAVLDLPQPRASTIAGETVVWSQGLIWGTRWVHGAALFTRQQEAYAQGLIWGLRYSVWGAGVVMNDGLYSDDQVLFGKDGEWRYSTWDDGTSNQWGALVRQPLSSSGFQWRPYAISSDFFGLESSGLIWGFRGAYGNGLIWGFRAAYGEGLIWGFRSIQAEGLIWGIAGGERGYFAGAF